MRRIPGEHFWQRSGFELRSWKENVNSSNIFLQECWKICILPCAKNPTPSFGDIWVVTVTVYSHKAPVTHPCFSSGHWKTQASLWSLCVAFRWFWAHFWKIPSAPLSPQYPDLPPLTLQRLMFPQVPFYLTHIIPCLSCCLTPQSSPPIGQLLILHILRQTQYQILHDFAIIPVNLYIKVWSAVCGHTILPSSTLLLNSPQLLPHGVVVDGRTWWVHSKRLRFRSQLDNLSSWLLRQVASPLWASVSSSIKWAQSSICQRASQEKLNWIMSVRTQYAGWGTAASQ